MTTFPVQRSDHTARPCSARDSGRNCLYFYPQKYPDEAERRGLCGKDATMRHGKLWVVEGMEGMPYIKPWKTVLTKRALAL